MVLLAPGTRNKEDIALVPPPLETITSLNGEECIFFTMLRYLFNYVLDFFMASF